MSRADAEVRQAIANANPLDAERRTDDLAAADPRVMLADQGEALRAVLAHGFAALVAALEDGFEQLAQAAENDR